MSMIRFHYTVETINLELIKSPVKQFKVLEHEKQPNGEIWYSVRVNDDILLWLNETFEYETDFRVVHHLKGVWVGMNEKTLALLQLKWS